MTGSTGASAKNSKKGGRPRMGPVLLLASLWGVLVAWQVAEHRQEEHRQRSGLVEAGRSNLQMLEAGLRTMCRQPLVNLEVLDSLAGEVSSVPGVLGITIAKEDGTVLAARGEPSPIPGAVAGAPEARWRDDGLVVARRADLAHRAPGGMPAQCRLSPAELPSHLFLLVDRAGMDRAIARDLRLRLGIIGAATAAIAGIFLLLHARSRTRRLRTELAVTEERSRRNREWALLGAGLAHETKNPLAFVRGAAQGLLENGADPAKARARTHEIVDEVDRVTARINEFLQYSRPVEPELETFRLEPFLEELGGLVQADLAPRRGRLAISSEPLTIHADRDMLRRILLNLLVNAARAIPEGGEIRLAARVRPSGSASIEVRDNGRGIERRDLDRVFQPYYTRAPGGTGLGLAIVRRLAEAHGWRVELESEEGTGTTVRILDVGVIPHEQPVQEDPRGR